MKLLPLYILFTASLSFGQLIRFEKVYGAWSHDHGYALTQTWDSGYAVVGSTSSYGNGVSALYLLKLDKYGNFLWHKALGGLNVDVGMSVVESSDSGIVCAGYTNSQGNGGYDAWILKTDQNGNVLWEKNYGGGNWDFANWISKTSGNGFIVCGSTQSSGNGNSDIWVLRLDANGDTLWTRTYGGTDEDEAAEIMELPSGHFYLTGKTKSFGSGGYDIISMKLGSNGDTTSGNGWHRVFGGNLDDEGTSVALHINNELISEGNTYSVGNGDCDGIHLRYDLNGNYVTYSAHWSPGFEAHYSVLTHETGNFVTFGDRGPGTGPQHDFRIDMIGIGGWYVWARDIGGPDNEQGRQIIRTKDGGFCAVGSTLSYGHGLYDIYIIKTDSAGQPSGTVVLGNDEMELLLNEKNIFPNPSSGLFNLVTDVPVQDLQLFDLSGRKIQMEWSRTDRAIQVSSLGGAGVYFLLVTTESGQYTLKVVFNR